MRIVILLALWLGTAAAGPTVVLVGNDHVSDATLKRVMRWVSDPETLEVDCLYVNAYYWDHGYAQSSVACPDYNDDKVEIVIREGATFTIGKVAIAAQHELVHVQSGELFSRARIADDRERVASYYADRGYAFVEVLPMSEVHAERGVIDLRFEVTRGPLARYGAIAIAGAPAEVVRPVLGIGEGERFAEHRLLAAKQALIELGYDVVLWTKHGKAADLVDVSLDLTKR